RCATKRYIIGISGDIVTDQNAKAAPAAKERPFLFFGLCAVLIAQFVFRAFTPAHEYPMRPEQVMTILFDACMVIGLFAVRNSGPKPLWWVALVAGVCLFLFRLTGDAAWWTGHLTYSLR